MCRFIPAYTGNSKERPGRPADRSVHPRVHGELGSDATPNVHQNGSSPRTRGTLLLAGQLVVGLRFIPAYTGNSAAARRHVQPEPVHPRVHGELMSRQP